MYILPGIVSTIRAGNNNKKEPLLLSFIFRGLHGSLVCPPLLVLENRKPKKRLGLAFAQQQSS